MIFKDKSRFNIYELTEILKLIEQYISDSEIARQYKVSRKLIENIRKRKVYKSAISYICENQQRIPLSSKDIKGDAQRLSKLT